MDLTVHRDLAPLRALEDEWRALWDVDPSASVFVTPEFLGPWWAERGAGTPAILEMRDGGALAGLAFLVAGDDGVVRFAGDADVTDYHSPIAAPDRREQVAAAVAGALAELGARATLDALDGTAGWADALGRAAKAAGFEVAERPDGVCPRIRLDGAYDDYLAALPSKLRHEIRRKERRLEREAGAYKVRMTGADTLDADLDAFYEMHRRSDGPKGHFLSDDVTAFFTALARAFCARGGLRLTWLETDQPLAAVLSFAARGVWNVYNSAFDHTKRDLGPGMVLMGESIRLAAAEGAHTFDLLRGDEPYKYRFGAVDTPLVSLELRRA
jgi:CelD/BcsL family acetyltransferase involved in cellulose biosynthesis